MRKTTQRNRRWVEFTLIGWWAVSIWRLYIADWRIGGWVLCVWRLGTLGASLVVQRWASNGALSSAAVPNAPPLLCSALALFHAHELLIIGLQSTSLHFCVKLLWWYCVVWQPTEMALNSPVHQYLWLSVLNVLFSSDHGFRWKDKSLIWLSVWSPDALILDLVASATLGGSSHYFVSQLFWK